MAICQISRWDKILIIPSINHSYCIAEQDNNLKAMQQSDILLPDGVAIVAVRMLSGEINKDCQADIHHHLGL
jgi:hypothetical protein